MRGGKGRRDFGHAPRGRPGPMALVNSGYSKGSGETVVVCSAKRPSGRVGPEHLERSGRLFHAEGTHRWKQKGG